MKKCFKRALSGILTAAMLFSTAAFTPVTVSAAGAFTTVGGWNECLYAEWQDSNPDAAAVKVGYKLSTDSAYTYLEGDDLTYLVRKASTSGLGRVDIPGLKAGRYDLEVTSSTGDVITRTGIRVYSNDRSGYAHWNNTEGIGGYKNDGTPKDNAIIIYVTDENKDTVEIPGYEGTTWSYTPSTGDPYTRTSEGVGNILNNNMKFIQQVTITDNHPLIIRFIGTVNPPKNLTPKGYKDPALGGGDKDNGNLAITKYGRNITIEGVGSDAVIEGWGFTFAQSDTCPDEAGKSFEVSNLTFQNYPEDGLGFQGDSNKRIERVWVHNNTFYPGYCADPMESDKKEGDGSCDFKRGLYYTLSYNHFVKCHKTNLLGSGTSDDQWYMTLHHNWYENVGSRQPLAANGNIHIYNTYFQDASSTTVDLRGSNEVLLESNYYDNCKNYFKSRNNTCISKSYNEKIVGGSMGGDSGTRTVVTSRDQAALADCGYKFPDGSSMANFDINPAYFYYDSANKCSDVEVMTPVEDVPAYVTSHAGVMQAYEETESGEIQITVKSGTTPVTGAKVTAPGLTFVEQGNGVYTAVASLGVAYTVTVSKEGYSNVTVDTTALVNNGDVFTAEASLNVDTDGYAVVKLAGGSAGEAVKGASVKLNDGTVLVDQNDGTYKSAAQIAVGAYTATITNTGDYVAPSSAVNVTVKTTDEATIINLEKYKGTVNVTLAAADGETETLDPSKASVTVGNTALTYSNGVFTGQVEVGTPYDVTVKMPGWNTVSVTPSQVTANRSSAVEAAASLTYKGQLFTWNYTDNTNTDNFFTLPSSPSDWSSAVDNPQDYEGAVLDKAIKMQSSTSITFEAPADGTLTLVMHSPKSGSSVKINDVTYSIDTGINTISVKAGTNTLTKGSNETHLYLLQYSAGDSTPVDKTTETTTTSSGVDTTVETTTSADPTPSGDGLAAGTYTLNKSTVVNASITGIDSSNVYSGTDNSAVKVRGTAYLAVKPAVSGTLTLTWSSNAPVIKSVGSDGTETDVTPASTASPCSLSVVAGTTYRIYGSKPTGNTNLTQLVLTSGGSVDTTTTQTTTETTTETTTLTTTETTTKTTTTEKPAETTTNTPVSGANVSIGSDTVKNGESVTIPVKISGISALASYDISVSFDSSKLSVDSVTAGDVITDSNAKMSYNITDGKVTVTGANFGALASGKDVLFNLNVTAKAEGTVTLTPVVNEMYASEGTTIEASASAGNITVEETVTPSEKKGDADGNGVVDEADVKHILAYVVGRIESVVNPKNADVNNDSKVSSSDAYLINKYVKGIIPSL